MNTALKKERIEKVAFKLFLEKGYSETGIRNICVKAGIEAPTLYYHYGSKKRLFFKIADNLLTGFFADNNCIYGIDTNIDASTALYNIFLGIMDFAAKNDSKTRFYIRYALFAPNELRKEVEAYLDDINGRLQAIISFYVIRCKEQGSIALPAETAAQYIIKFINANTFDIVFSGWMPTQEELAELWTEFFWCRLRGENGQYKK